MDRAVSSAKCSTSKTSKICQDDWAFQRKAKASASKISIQQILEISINFHFAILAKPGKEHNHAHSLISLGMLNWMLYFSRRDGSILLSEVHILQRVSGKQRCPVLLSLLVHVFFW